MTKNPLASDSSVMIFVRLSTTTWQGAKSPLLMRGCSAGLPVSGSFLDHNRSPVFIMRQPGKSGKILSILLALSLPGPPPMCNIEHTQILNVTGIEGDIDDH